MGAPLFPLGNTNTGEAAMPADYVPIPTLVSTALRCARRGLLDRLAPTPLGQTMVQLYGT
jgi:hypothetical protein